MGWLLQTSCSSVRRRRGRRLLVDILVKDIYSLARTIERYGFMAKIFSPGKDRFFTCTV
jgi:hypothetical protein